MCTLKISFQYGKVNHKTTMCTQSDHCLHDRTHAIEHATVEQFDDSEIEAIPHFDKTLLKARATLATHAGCMQAACSLHTIVSSLQTIVDALHAGVNALHFTASMPG